MGIKEIIFGEAGGITKQQLAVLVQRDKFSDFLPWLGYSEDKQTFLNTDNTIGYAWECVPLSYAGLSEIKSLESILNIDLPKVSVMQFILYADPNVEAFVESYKGSKLRDDELVKKNVSEYARFLQEGAEGVPTMHGIPTRNFRLWVTLKSEENISEDHIAVVEEGLKAAHLNPVRWKGSDLMSAMRSLFNGYTTTYPGTFDNTVPMRKQIIEASTEIDFDKDRRIGDIFATCITPKTLRANGKIDPLVTNRLGGGIMGMMEDTRQIATPFLWTVNVIFDEVKSDIGYMASLTMMQRAGGSFAKKIGKRVEEYGWALEKADTGAFVRVIPSMWIFARTPEQLRDSVSRAKGIWRTQEFIMQEETVLSKVMFIQALPFGLYTAGYNIKTLDRDFPLPASSAARFLPIQADYRGASRPVLAYVGRKGQLVGVDVFDKRSNNHNFVVSAGSGSGKSFTLNNLCNSYYASGELIRIVDLGYSYKKLCSTCGGRFMDFGEERVVINPFFCPSDDKEEIDKNLMVASNIIGQMAYSASGAILHETEWTLIKSACRYAVKSGDVENGIDAVVNYLKVFPKHVDNVDEHKDLDFAVNKAHELAFNLTDFKSTGIYGRFFNGKSTFDISSDEFVVLELERLRTQRELFSVVIMQVMNSVTQDLYLSDRSRRRFILFEEAASFLKKNGQQDLSRLGNIVEEGYRRARKYSGSFGVVLQSMLDLLDFGPVGRVIFDNAAYKFYLEGKEYGAAVDSGLLDFKGLALDLLTSVKNNKPKYSEMFLDTPFGAGVARLAVDKWTYWVNTSDGGDVAKYEKLIAEGLTPHEALIKLSGVS